MAKLRPPRTDLGELMTHANLCGVATTWVVWAST